MSSPLRVAIDLRSVADGDRGGVARFAIGITEALAQRRWLTVLPFATTALTTDLSVDLHLLGGGGSFRQQQLALPRLLSSLKADVLLSPANHGLPVTAPCPMVLVVHETVAWDDPEGIASVTGTRFSRSVSLSRAARIVTLSEHSQGAITRRLGVAASRIRVVPGGVDERFFAPLEEEIIERARVNYGVSRGSVLHVGGLKARRNLPTLVRAIASLPADIAPRLTLAGSGPEGEGLASMARLIGLGERFHLAGFVEDADLPAVYRAAACVVLAGTEEGFGLPALEAMASGTPVVAARAGALPEVTARAARLFPAEDVTALAGHLRDVLSSPDEQRRMAILGRQQAAKYTWEQAGSAMETVLREACEPSSSRRAPGWAITALRNLFR